MMKAEMTELVMPGDTNHLGTCFGGKIMSWIDLCAAIAAQRLVGTVVTASVDSIEFKKSIKVGDVVTIQASVNAVWNTSLEVGVRVMVQSPTQLPTEDTTYMYFPELQQACRAYLTFVAVDNKGQRRRVSHVKSQYNLYDHAGKRRFEEADKRREIRLANRK
jgi:acyl-CoA hydrolase